MSDDRFAPIDGEGLEAGDIPATDDELKWPFGFIAVLVLAALYLGWRLIQLLSTVIDWIS